MNKLFLVFGTKMQIKNKKFKPQNFSGLLDYIFEFKDSHCKTSDPHPRGWYRWSFLVELPIIMAKGAMKEWGWEITTVCHMALELS